MVNSEPPPRRPPSTEGGSEARDVSNPVMANITKYQHIESTTEPMSIGDVAQVKGALRHDWLGVVRAEERSNLFKELISERLGTDDV